MRKQRMTAPALDQLLQTEQNTGRAAHPGPASRRRPVRHRPETRQAGPDRSAATTREDIYRLLAGWPGDVDKLKGMSQDDLVRQIALALHTERRRARQGHWAYDITRHINLSRILKTEGNRLRRLKAHRRLQLYPRSGS
ncbi:MAG: hypothetical protein ACR2O4_12065 [Hyphomicrobiaceae bacterium]